jgi:hypothetical protein
MMKKRHKWIFASEGKDPLERDYSQYKCEYCGLEKRFYERRSDKAFGGTTLDECILINGGWKRLYKNGLKMPECKRKRAQFDYVRP